MERKEIRIIVSAIRFILAMFISLALAISPVAAAVYSVPADSSMSMEHCHKTPGKTTSGHCDCCDKDKVCTPASCAAHCAKIPACLPTIAQSVTSIVRDFPRLASAGMAQRVWPPPAPPPRV